MPAFAFSIASSTLAGQNLGANKPHQARVSALYCLAFSEIIMFTIGSLLFLHPQWFINLFISSSAADVSVAASDFLRILALCLPGLGVGMTINGVLRGSGDTRAAASITLVAMWLVRLPLAAFMSMSEIGGLRVGLGLGLNGVWWAMTISVYVEASLAFLRFASGKWTKIKLAEV